MTKLPKIRFFLALAILITASLVHADIKDLFHFRDILDDMAPGVFFVFDNDNTLTRPKQTLGSNQWYVWQLQQFQSQGMTAQQAFEKTEALWVKIENKTEVKLTEPDVAQTIKIIQTKNATMLETARSTDLHKATVEQLRSVGINFLVNPPSRSEVTVKSNPGSLYTDGIFHMGNGGDKGKDLVGFLKETGLQFTKIIFADDQMENVQAVSDALTKAGIAHTAYHYRREDLIVKEFKPETAEIQMRVFEKTGALIPDRIAECSNKVDALLVTQ